MATIVFSRFALGTRTPPRPQSAGAVHVAKFPYTFTTALPAGAILELGVLPEFAHIVDYKLVPEGAFAGVTCSAGIMTGEVGVQDNARDAGTELFAAGTALDALKDPAKIDALVLSAVATPRGIGLKFSGQVAADPAKKVNLILFYAQ
ncbi:hypothetical protein LWE61_15010 [Sphingobium sufflavum]|uniref:hypothetical protein n=1 Tax=Sphingobium sufflavum TaxID=1129547 RepID=UPI001F400D52|nr:hypothetical protein [Sphingobium sufflavum]MCE7797860.1 hypothetical protein [Sphingobium sufflavum]